VSREPSQSELDYNARRMQSLHDRRKYVDGCKTCADIKAHEGHGPSHDASARCESGCHSHCSCDTCF
jgi:hypothetical protein